LLVQRGMRAARITIVLILMLLGAVAPRTSVAAPMLRQRLSSIGQKWLVKRGLRLQSAVNRWRTTNAETFRKIAQGDYTNQLVLYRDAEMTAFVDWTDVDHPGHNGGAVVDTSLRGRPNAAHVLFIPNEEHAHLGIKLESKFHYADVKRTERLMKKAEELGDALGLGRVEIFQNSAQAVSVGWQHIHLIGDKPDGFRYPASLASPH
jgi:hypothetical protein